MVDSPGRDAPRMNHRTPEVPLAEADGASNEVEVTLTSVTKTTSGTAGPEPAARPTPITDPPTTVTATPPVPSCPIDMEKAPAFLRCHGKGNRRVNILKYLNELQDPHFHEVLLYYINFETNDKSNINGLLPTAGWPSEISQWTSRARPANLPDYTKDG